MHICFLCNEYPPGMHGGIGAFTQTLARKLVVQGHQVSVLGIGSVPLKVTRQDAGVCVCQLPATRLPWAGFLLNGARLRHEIAEMSLRTPFDLIEGPESAFAMLSARSDVARIIRMHGGHHFFAATLGSRPRLWRSCLERRSFALADALCAVSQFVADETKRLLRIRDRPIRVVPNPVDTERFRPRPEVSVVPGRIVFVGTLCEKKGIRQLIQALPRILRSVPHARLLVVGRDSIDPGTGGSYREGLIQSIHLESRISFKDHLENSDLPSELAAAEVLVFPSHMEAQGLVVIEGMAMGKPVVASGTGPGPELIEHGVSGLLCNPHDPASIAAAVIAVLKDRNLAGVLSRSARQRAVSHFSIGTLVHRNEEFYQDCMERKADA